MTTKEREVVAAINTLWPYLMKSKDHPEQRLTAHGFKSKAELAAYITESKR